MFVHQGSDRRRHHRAGQDHRLVANALYRLQGFLARWRLAPLALIVHLVNKWLNGCVIGVRASFGAGFVLIHPVGIVINSATRGGRNVWVESSVVIGDNRGRSPVIGDDVFIGSGAKIIGGVHILHDVPAGATVVGIPARPLAARAPSEGAIPKA